MGDDTYAFYYYRTYMDDHVSIDIQPELQTSFMADNDNSVQLIFENCCTNDHCLPANKDLYAILKCRLVIKQHQRMDMDDDEDEEELDTIDTAVYI